MNISFPFKFLSLLGLLFFLFILGGCGQQQAEGPPEIRYGKEGETPVEQDKKTERAKRTALSPPEDYVEKDLPFVQYGEKIPRLSLEDPLKDREIQIRQMRSSKLLTFFYSTCKTVCPALIGTLRYLQNEAIEGGYAERVDFVAVTFDPARDTEKKLRNYAGKFRIDLKAGNWHFLRPETAEEAKSVVGRFGVKFKKFRPEENEPYMFYHTAIIYLINSRGYVERVYLGKNPVATNVSEDLKKVLEESR